MKTRICIDEGEVITYKGFEIRPTDDPWLLKYHYAYEFFNDEQIHHAMTLDEAYQFIDELTEK